jgi:hypothetical protein
MNVCLRACVWVGGWVCARVPVCVSVHVSVCVYRCACIGVC